jgi:hypothetical protein
MKRWRLVILVLAFLLVLQEHVVSQSVNVPLEHWAYDFLKRLEARGACRSLYLRTLPMSRQQLAAILAQIERSDAQKTGMLSRAERDRFEQLKGEFHEEIAELNLKSQMQYQEIHLWQWSENNARAKVDLDFRQRFDFDKRIAPDTTQRTSFTTLGGIVRGSLNKDLGFYLHFKNTLIRGQKITAENFNPAHGYPLTISGKNVYQDEATAYIIWRLPWFQLEAGRDRVQWGPGSQGSLMISAQNPLFDLIKLQASFKQFQFTSFHGWLTSDLGPKYLAAHRLDVQLRPWLYLAAAEAVVYGNREVEFQYLNPLMPYHIAEHHLGDRDNNTMSFECTLFPRRGHKLYGELFIDDFTSAKNPFRYYGNKFAFLVGHHWANPFRLRNVDARIEYARIEPYVYTHDDSINVYENYNRILGHWLGPNADQLYFEIGFQPHRDLKTSLLVDRVRHGEGDVHTPYAEDNGTRKKFLSGVVETRWRLGFAVTDQILRDWFLTLHYYYSQLDNRNRIPGQDGHDYHLLFQLSANW